MDEEYRNALLEGSVLDTYRIEKVLGIGCYGITYLVRDLNVGKVFVMKEFLPDGIAIRLSGKPTVIARSSSNQDNFDAFRECFISEARIFADIDHPAVVSVHRLMEENGTHYMVMDYIEGDTLDDYLEKNGGNFSGIDEFQKIFNPLMSGLDVLHSRGIIHRGIKPENIMVKPDGSPVLLDFRTSSQTQRMTQLLSDGYSPLDQSSIWMKQGPYTDVYALGATMYRCITGQKPDAARDRMREDTYQALLACGEFVSVYGSPILMAVDQALKLDAGQRLQNIVGLWDVMGLQFQSDKDASTHARVASKWYRKAAEQGDQGAQYNLGGRYESGRGVNKDEGKAVEWFRKAAEQGHARGQCSLGVMYVWGIGVSQDDGEAVKWLRKAAEQGDAKGQHSLGLMYAKGRGVIKDEPEAVEWYRKATKQGYARAQLDLGHSYYYGRGVSQDESEAVKWYREAAKQGIADSQYKFGWMYASATGIIKDESKATKW
jgi:TPR repeat protein